MSKPSQDVHDFNLETALINHDLRGVKTHIEAGAKVNLINAQGETLIWQALRQKDYKIVQFLADSGANVNSVDRDGLTILHHLASTPAFSDAMRLPFALGPIGPSRSEIRKTIEALVNNGVNINSKDNNGLTPLHHTALSPDGAGGILQNFSNLIRLGANINGQDNNGLTPLHHAIKNSNVKNVKFLLKADADINIQDNNRKTPLQTEPSNSGELYDVSNRNIAQLLQSAKNKLEQAEEKSNRSDSPSPNPSSAGAVSVVYNRSTNNSR